MLPRLWMKPSSISFVFGVDDALLISGGMNLVGGLAGGIMGSNASEKASDQQAAALRASIAALGAGQQNAFNTMAPYYEGGTANYDYLNYLLTGVKPQGPEYNPYQVLPGWYTSAFGTPGTGGGSIGEGINALDQFMGRWEGMSAANKYPSHTVDLQSSIAQLKTLQAQEDAAKTANTMISNNPNLPGGYLMNIPKFAYDPTTDPSFTGAFDVAADEIAAKQAQTGAYGSGNMASALLNESALLEPEFENLALTRYGTNEINPRSMIYNMLTGNVGGAGQQVAGNLASMYTGTAGNVANQVAQVGNAQAAGTLGSANSYTNMLSNMTGGTNSLMGLYLTNQMLDKIKSPGGGNITSAPMYTNAGVQNMWQNDPMSYYGYVGSPY